MNALLKLSSTSSGRLLLHLLCLGRCLALKQPANRLADKWRPLFAIAQVVGGHWPERTADAFHALNPKSHKSIIQIQPKKITSADSADLKPNFSEQSKIENRNSKIHAETNPHSEAPSLQLTPTLHHSSLLSSLRSIFRQAGADRLFSTIVACLRAVPDRPWSGAHNGHKPIDEAWLALQLRPLAIGPHNVRIAGAQAKGYRLPTSLRLSLASSATSLLRVLNRLSVIPSPHPNSPHLNSHHCGTATYTTFQPRLSDCLALSRMGGNRPSPQSKDCDEPELGEWVLQICIEPRRVGWHAAHRRQP